MALVFNEKAYRYNASDRRCGPITHKVASSDWEKQGKLPLGGFFPASPIHPCRVSSLINGKTSNYPMFRQSRASFGAAGAKMPKFGVCCEPHSIN